MEKLIPRRGRGRPSNGAAVAFEAHRARFVEFMKKLQSTLDFKMSSRGWCYALEPHGLLKGDFDYGQGLINDCRREGLLPMGFMLDEEGRAFDIRHEYVDEEDPEEYAKGRIKDLFENTYYTKHSFWDQQEYYVQMLVEKIDLKSLFSKVCNKYYIPCATTKGWASIGQREELIGRFIEHEAVGRKPVLLTCGDHDPAGLNISDTIRKNLNDLERSTGWRADDLIIDRFGLNGDFIIKNNLTWIDNLATASGEYPLDNPKHPDHNKPYVQNYIKEWGVRKCEANAIVVVPALGRALCETTINKYISKSSVMEHIRMNNEAGNEVKTIIIELMTRGEFKRYITR